MLLPPNASLFPALAVLLLPLARGQVVFPTPGLNPFSVCSAATVGAAVYIMSNEDFNTVISLPIAPDGRISIGTVTATGGAGAVGLGADGKPVGGDALFSQSSLIVAGGALFAVNAGSNTLSMFAIDDANPAVLRLLGTPAAVPGDFPNTVAVSLRHKLACVATTGKRSGVSCANFSLSKGLGAFDALRDFDFTNDLRQSTPPVGPPNTVSHAFFSEDQSQLIVTVKGDPAGNSRNGFVARYDVNGASCDLNAAGMRNPARIYTGYLTPVDGMKLPFGSVVIPDSKDIKTKGRILVTDPSFGAAIISPKTPSLGFNVDTRIVIGGGKAVCWATTSPATGTIFVTDGAVNRLVEISPDDGRILSILDLSSTGAGGLLDIVGAGNYLYSLSAGSAQASITVVDVSRGKQTQKLHQHLSLGSLAGKRAMGMAALLD